MVRLLAPSGPPIGEAQQARRDARESSDFCRLIQPKAIRHNGIASTLNECGGDACPSECLSSTFAVMD